jgi:hypothetical protein
MNPKKASRFYKTFAEENSYEEVLVESAVEFYYKTVRSLLTNLSYPRINIDGLGHITAKPLIVKNTIDKLHKVLDGHDTSTFNAYHNKKAMELKLDNLLKLHEKILEQKEKKNNFFKTKKDEKRT